MYSRAWLQRKPLTALIPHSCIELYTCHHNIKVPEGGIQVMIPHFNSQHKVSFLMRWDCVRSWISGNDPCCTRRNADFIDAIDKFIVKHDNKSNNHYDWNGTTKNRPVLRLGLVPEELSGTEKVCTLDEVAN